MTFNLKTLLYFFALMAVVLAVFGAWGVLVALVILLVRAIAWRFWEYRVRFVQWSIMGISVYLVVFELLIRVQINAPPSYIGSYFRISQIVDDLLFVAESESNLCFADSEYSHSWRSDVWNYELRESINYGFDGPAIDFSKSWEKAAGARVLQQNPFATIDRPYAGRLTTDLFAVVDGRTAWINYRTFDLNRVTDSVHETILIIEVGGYDIPFTEPRDLEFAEAVEVLAGPIRSGHGDGHTYKTGFFFHDVPFRHVVTCDGCVHRLYQPLPREVAVAVLTARGGERVDLEPYTTIKPRLDWGRVWSVATLVALAIMPGKWLLH